MILTRKQLNEKYNISKNLWGRRKEALMEHLREYMDITEIESTSGRFSYEIVGELPEIIPELPRVNAANKRAEKYQEFTLNALGEEFKPNSKIKVSREAIEAFGRKEYNHENAKAVSKKYVSPVFEEKGEKSKDMVWVKVKTYEILNEEELTYLKECFKKVNLTEKKMAEAYIKIKQGASTVEEDTSFEMAICYFKEKYGFRPIKVYKWKIK